MRTNYGASAWKENGLHPRRRLPPIVALAYVGALVALGVTRTVLGLAPDLQFLAAGGTFLIAGAIGTWRFGNPGWLTGRLHGNAALLNGLTIFVAIAATLATQQSLPDSWPLAATGLILPLFLIAELVIDWPHLEGNRGLDN